MSSCSLRTADFKVSKLDISRGRVSTLPPCSLRNWIGRTPHQYSSLVISHSSQKALRPCCSALPETRTITRSETGSEEIKPSSLASQLIPNLHEVETLLTNICETSSIAEFELKLSGFNLRMARGLKSKNLPLPPVPSPAPDIQHTSSIPSDSNGLVKTTSLALFKRLHFCEFEAEITAAGDRVFLIYIGNNMADQGIDVFQRAGGKGRPMYEDYGIFVSNTNQKKVNLSVKLQANPDDAKTRLNNVILNGVEIFKINDLNGNLGGQNPDPPPTTPAQSLPPSIPQSNNPSNTKIVGIVIPVVVGGVVAILALGLFLFRRRKTFTDQTSSDGTSWWASNLTWTKKSNKSSKTRNSNLPSDICRHFSLGEIKDATKNFDEIFIIGVGGFGNVYKGYIDDGATQVAIKRLKPGSKQGAHEFKTEIEMLSQLRHLHLVSLIGYCNDGNEMILVYDYMSHGTLRSHLYGNDEQQPLTWNQRLQVCIGAAKGLHYLHTGANHTIIHRDVKTTNILLDEKWIAKVSDFGLSKVGPANMPNNAHISTVVKGSFGYLDPEYYRRQQLTEKSDVYSFGVVLCEVLCARPPLIRAADKKQVYLAEWVRRCHRDNTVAQTIDPNIKNEISPECLRKFIEIAVGCIEDDGIKRPSMNDVVWGLEFGLKLQEASKKKGAEDDVGSGEEQWFLDETLFSSTGDGRHDSESGVSSYVTTTNSNDLSYTQNKGMSSTVFSEINDPIGR